MKIINLDHFVLSVKNLDKSIYFYNEIIGLPIIKSQTNDDFASLKCGHSLLRLRKVENKVNAIVANKLATGVYDFCLETDSSINEIITNYQNHNIPIELGPVTKHGAYGKMTSVYVRDPDNNLVEICTYE
ncbi:VOC family protein [Lactobacillus sp. LL6]|uniref:VOC family protein n=1 Tax=Lactobacillus sp. LL6 TaxID=2596827 RepID=UPI001185431A|nr:VOC family protein [Lactobacillus sp. LL6]TSO26295.1 virulence protein [Lactobacillus sp. LL6]